MSRRAGSALVELVLSLFVFLFLWGSVIALSRFSLTRLQLLDLCRWGTLLQTETALTPSEISERLDEESTRVALPFPGRWTKTLGSFTDHPAARFYRFAGTTLTIQWDPGFPSPGWPAVRERVVRQKEN